MSNSNTPKANEIITIGTNDIPEVIRSHHDRLEFTLKHFGHRRGLTYPLFLSMPGVGKSESGYVTATALGRQHFDIRGGDILPSDVRLPAADLEKEVAKYLGNADFPFITKDGEVNKDQAILGVLDELLDANLPVQRMFKQLTNDNKIGNLRCPDNTLWVAFANGLEHGCSSERMPLSNANRTAWYEIPPSVDSFKEYLENHPFGYPVLEAFVQTNTDAIYQIEPKNWDGKSNFASFRTLEEFGRLIEAEWTVEHGSPDDEDYKREFKGISHDRLATAKLNAILGYSSAKKAETFLQIYEAVGSIENLLRDPKNCKIPNDLPTKWVIACKLVGESTMANVEAVMTVAQRLLGAKSFIEAYVAKSICKSKPKLQGAPCMRSWMAENALELCGR